MIQFGSKHAYVKWVFVSFLACLDMLRARAYSPTPAAIWLRIQTFLNRANVHHMGQRFGEESFLGLMTI